MFLIISERYLFLFRTHVVLVKRSFTFAFSVHRGFRRGDSDLLEGRSFWYNAYNLTLMDFRSRIYCCVGNGSEIRDSRTIENTKCQNDKIIFIFCRYQP